MSKPYIILALVFLFFAFMEVSLAVIGVDLGDGILNIMEFSAFFLIIMGIGVFLSSLFSGVRIYDPRYV